MLRFRECIVGKSAILRYAVLAIGIVMGLTGNALASCGNNGVCAGNITPTGAPAGQTISIPGSGFQGTGITITGVSLAGVPANVEFIGASELIVQAGTPPSGLPSGLVTVYYTYNDPKNGPISYSTFADNLFFYDSAMTMSTDTLTTGTVYNAPYSQGFTVTGGTGPYSYKVLGGSLPQGTSLSCTSNCGNTVAVTGTMGTNGSFSYQIQATDQYGQSTSASASGATAPPSISSISPSSGKQSGGDSITITGMNLLSVQSVTVGGQSVTFTTPSGQACGCTAGSQLLFATPSATSPGPVNVVITTSAGQASTNYTYLPVPTITQVTPSVGPLSGGQSIAIQVTNGGWRCRCCNGATAVTNVTSRLSPNVNKWHSGAAMAMQAPTLSNDDRFGIRIGYGNFDSSANAVGLTAVGVVCQGCYLGVDRFTIDAGASIGMSTFTGYGSGPVTGARVGANFTW
jgi:hypothetical protein